MNGILMPRRFLSEATRNTLYLDCMNRKFDDVLRVVRSTSANEMDYAFLQLYLSRSCQWGHIASVTHIWDKYVLRLKMMTVHPSLLCEIGNLALNEGKHFLPPQIYHHYVKFFSGTMPIDEEQRIEYELLRIKVESFAKGTMLKTRFREKWKVLLEDMDHHLSSAMELRVRDFPYLTKSVQLEDNEMLMKLLFDQNKLDIKNRSTAPLLLNIILSQPQQSIESKISLFEKFYDTHRSLKYDDTLTILFRLCKGDGYRLSKLGQMVEEKGLNPLSSVALRAFTNGIKDTEYSFDQLTNSSPAQH